MRQKKKQRTYKTSIINNVRVTSATKREFYQNREFYKSQGIKSAQRLQEQKNIQSKIKRAETLTKRKAIKAAYELDKDKYVQLGYTLEQFIKIYNSFQKWNERIEDAIQKNKIMRTGKLSFPIDSKGHINLKRLAFEIKNSKKTVAQIKKAQRDYIYNNFNEIYGSHQHFSLFTKLYRKTPAHTTIRIMDDLGMYFFFRYDIRDFTDDARDHFWNGEKEKSHQFDQLIVAMADDVNDYETLGVFGL